MRLRVLIPVFLVGVLALVVGLWFIPRGSPRETPPELEPPGAEPVKPTRQAVVEPAPAARSTGQMAAAVTVSEPVGGTHETYVAQRCAELEDLATDDQPESLATILGELTNRDPEIRKAAREAAMQFGSREAIPKLLDAASQTDDPEERVALLEAAEFLKLPSLTELAQQAKTNSVSGSR